MDNRKKFIELIEDYTNSIGVHYKNEEYVDLLEKRLEIKNLYTDLLKDEFSCTQQDVEINTLSQLQKSIENINNFLKKQSLTCNEVVSKYYLKYFLDLSTNIENYDADGNYLSEVLLTIPHLNNYLNSYYDARRKTTEHDGQVTEILKSREENILLYRGHTNREFNLVPNLYRNKGHYTNENILYKETYMSANDQFTSAKSHLEKLTIMQHYGLPTRLLDLTKNPLVAVYFAVTDYDQALEKNDAEIIIFNMKSSQIKYYDSDSVSILAALSILDYGEKHVLFKTAVSHLAQLLKNSFDDNKEISVKALEKQTLLSLKAFNEERIVKKLNREIEKESGMYLKEIHPVTLLSLFAVYPMPNNNRISRQQGLFFIPGLFNPKSTQQHLEKLRFSKRKNLGKKSFYEFLEKNICPHLELEHLCNFKLLINTLECAHNDFIPETIRFIIPAAAKSPIKKELELFGINESTIYPDITNVINMIKSKYVEK